MNAPVDLHPNVGYAQHVAKVHGTQGERRMSPPVSVSGLAQLLAQSLEEVRAGRGTAPSAQDIESATFLAYQAMTGRSRDYHGLAHIFAVAEGLPALARLATVYHDIVYFHVDGGFPPSVSTRLGDVVELRDNKVFLTAKPDALVSDLATIFGFTPGQELSPFGGLSEFLSAALAVRELTPFLSKQDLWAVAACIEATVPFRKETQGNTQDAQLGKRLALLRDGAAALSPQDIERIQVLAVQLANADVQSFAQEDLGDFLEDTWKLLPETNPELQKVGAYSIRKFREGLGRMEGFLSNLDPGVIYRQHGTTPSAANFAAMRERAANNLRRATDYLRAKIVAMCVLEGLAELTGGDGPISYFTGAADSGQTQVHQLLHPLTLAAPPPLDADVLRVLTVGRHGQSRFDTAASPLAAHFYTLLGSAGVAQQVVRARDVYAAKQDWKWFLSGLPRDVVVDVAQAMSQVAVVRKQRFQEFING
jgi:hypothetical protein